MSCSARVTAACHAEVTRRSPGGIREATGRSWEIVRLEEIEVDAQVVWPHGQVVQLAADQVGQHLPNKAEGDGSRSDDSPPRRESVGWIQARYARCSFAKPWPAALQKSESYAEKSKSQLQSLTIRCIQWLYRLYRLYKNGITLAG